MSYDPSEEVHRDATWSEIKQMLHRIVELMPSLKTGIPSTLALSALSSLALLTIPIITQQVINEVVQHTGDVANLDLVPIGLKVLLGIGLAIVSVGISVMAMRRYITISEHALAELRTTTFAHIHSLSMLQQQNQRVGLLVARVTTDIDVMATFMSYAGPGIVIPGIQVILIWFVMAWMNIPLAIIVTVEAALLLWVMKWFQQRIAVAFRTSRTRLSDLLSVIAETVHGSEVIRSYRIEQASKTRSINAVYDFAHTSVNAGIWASRFSAVSSLGSNIILISVLVAGTLLGVGGYADIGTIVVYPMLVTLFIGPLLFAGESFSEGQDAFAGLAKVFTILDVKPDIADTTQLAMDSNPILANHAWNDFHVEIEHMSFGYPGADDLALKDISLTVEAGTHVAIVGETGSGKSTFSTLLTRLVEPTEGTIKIGDVDINLIPDQLFREHVLMVPQADHLLDGSILHNLQFADPTVDEARGIEIFAELGLSEWLSNQTQGIHTTVGEDGGYFSAGERQLISLARAYTKHPSVLVLDEATSSVDPATESHIRNAMNVLTAGATTFTIAHRLSTARQADIILLFDHGVMVEQGNHDALLALQGMYADLWASWEAGNRTGSDAGATS